MGCKLAVEQWELTPIQRFVYIMAKDKHTPDEVKKAPAGMDKGNELIKNF